MTKPIAGNGWQTAHRGAMVSKELRGQAKALARRKLTGDALQQAIKFIDGRRRSTADVEAFIARLDPAAAGRPAGAPGA